MILTCNSTRLSTAVSLFGGSKTFSILQFDEKNFFHLDILTLEAKVRIQIACSILVE